MDQTFAAAFDKLADRVEYLKSRWIDESQYENFAEYVKNLQALGDSLGLTDVALNRKFQVSFVRDGKTYFFRLTRSKIELFFGSAPWLKKSMEARP